MFLLIIIAAAAAAASGGTEGPLISPEPCAAAATTLFLTYRTACHIALLHRSAGAVVIVAASTLVRLYLA
jgi:hypothetical protein